MALLSRRGALGALLALAAAAASVAFAQSQPATSVLERRVKAALLSQFAELVSWPESALEPGGTLVVAVVGAEQLADELRQLAGARAAGRPIRVRAQREGESLEGVQILFVAGGSGTEALREARDKPVLVVTDSAGALEQGSVINFATVDGKVRFELSVAGAEQRGLKLSPRLVAVALKR